MMLTTKSRYAVMAILDIAATNNKEPVTLSDIATRQRIGLKYLEQIFAKLKKAQIVNSVRGPGGGYVLTSDINTLKIISIIDAVEEKIKITGCKNGVSCNKSNKKCNSHNLWHSLGIKIQGYFNAVSVSDVLQGNL